MSRTLRNTLFTTLAAPLLLLAAPLSQPATAAPAGAFASPVVATADLAAVAAKPVEPTATSFANCTELREVYPHGVAKRYAVDKVKGNTKPVHNFTVAPKVYALNKRLDRDQDKIACEKR
ncbi:excalibur calcium-binding domain-containing protein [Catenuloplanes sp. NPDC051500]|uniref:excalibur calcium-binding domain-containing protein n=1 Tax=Catenuloplanes sp. NPDC051500 TaxID=3363959 RepID=UPI00378EB2F6